jgi:hypothetical protein
MRILISGASGFVGTPLSSFLSSQGHTVIALVRAQDRRLPNYILWDPEEGKASLRDFEGFDVVIHLAGEPLTLTRWSKEKRDKILYSRTVGTMFLSHLLSLTAKPPQLFIAASAFGYYGDRGDEILTEESGPGEGFLPAVCSAWEKASYAIENRGARVARARFGMVLGPNGGALQKMILPYRLGLGGRLGSGKQWMSWIALDDLIRAIDHIIHTDSLSGPINLVSPNPVRQEDFSKTLAELLHRPHFFSIPRWALYLALGKMVDDFLLASARVKPTKLLASNFTFNYPDFRSALCKAHLTE